MSAQPNYRPDRPQSGPQPPHLKLYTGTAPAPVSPVDRQATGPSASEQSNVDTFGKSTGDEWFPESATIDLTLIIPAYNEEKRLPHTLAIATHFLDEWGLRYRLLVVDDGSRDRTSQIAREFGRCVDVLTKPNGGKGSAVRMGMLAATGKIVAFTDADLPFAPESLKAAYSRIHSGEVDLVLGSRTEEGADTTASTNILRHCASFVFRGLANLILPTGVRDTQCGLKFFRRSVAQAIFSRTTINGFAFDVEAIYWARRLGYRISVLPVTLVNEAGSTVSLSRNAWPMLRDLMQVRWRELKNPRGLPASTVNASSVAPGSDTASTSNKNEEPRPDLNERVVPESDQPFDQAA